MSSASISVYPSRFMVHLGVLLVLASIVYMPWASAPFPMLDYSEFLQPLRASSSFGEGLSNLAAYYRSHGRSSYLAYLQLAGNWSLFGDSPVAWSVMVFACMFAALAAGWLLLVRLGNPPLAATSAAILLIVATPAIPGWIRPSGEPLALLFLCVAILAALPYPYVERWLARAVVILLLLLGIGLSKDLLAPLAAIPVVIALRGQPRFSNRNVALLAGAALVAALLAVMIGSALLDRAPDAYTRAYRAGNVTPGGYISVFFMMLLPYTSSAAAPHVIGSALFVLTVLIGWRLNVRADGAPNKRLEAAAWLGLAAFGALLYSPVSWYSPLYGLPFFFASVALMARALAHAQLAGATVRKVLFGLTTVVLVIGVGSAFNRARTETAERRLNGQLAGLLGRVAVDSVMIALPEINPWAWAQQSATLRRYAAGGDASRSSTATRDVPCGMLRADSVPAVRILLINYPEKCGALAAPAGEVVERHLLLTPLPVTRELRAQYVLLGPRAGARPKP